MAGNNSQIVPDVGIVTVFRFLEQSNVRVIVRQDQTVWFVAPDVCDALELGNTTMALRRLDEEEKGLNSIETLGGSQQVNIISESGLYSLVLSSKKPEAKPFKDWITKEVLPSIRQQGFYFAGGALTRERVQMVKLARQLTLDVAKSRDHFSRLMLRGLLAEVATALGQPLAEDPELTQMQQALKDQPRLAGV